MTGRRPSLLVAVVAIVLTAAGCTGVVAGTASPDPSITTVERAYGNVSTVDYCSLVEPQYAPRTGDDLPSMDLCLIYMEDSGTKVNLLVGPIVKYETNNSANVPVPIAGVPAGVEVRGRETERGCQRNLYFPGQMALVLRVSQRDDDSGPPLAAGVACTMADNAATGAVRSIGSQRVRHWTYGDRSLGNQEACAMLPDDLVATTASMPGVRARPQVHKHNCDWYTKDDGPLVQVLLGFIKTSETPDPETIGGRPAKTQPTTASGRLGCRVTTRHVPAPADKLQEFARIEVSLPSAGVTAGTGGQACTMARQLAEVAFAKLARP
ncbi:hypothetical protein EV193_112102 [Herbihabitans rhizosphaerae]|uniref:DUF3558 domain-containing protein n=1 Tax=Herbihabitans rhizosphaerae TaxID=1872711 RepID=A0A4Q7KHW6_9PSEU|nr:hypothetical protein [Herbihabitans rhizosphaerae]RZS32468.1 hypothetical protein EV193_112102 [Herbihabitans rhizosphaerae]